MKKKALLLASCLMLVCGALWAQQTTTEQNANGSVGMKISDGGVTTEVIFYTPSIVRVIKYPEGSNFEKVSMSISKQPEKVALKSVENESQYSVASGVVRVFYNKTNGSLSFYNTENGEEIISEIEKSTQFRPITDIGEATYQVAQTFKLEDDEMVYGLGQQQKGLMNQRGQELYLFNQNMAICMPFFHSSKGYGLYWDNYSPTKYIDNENGLTFDSEVGDCIDYYLLYGGDADGVIADIRDLTGDAPMYPLWTMGFWQCRERYESQKQLLEVLHKYRDLKVPLDGIVQDWRYWGASLTDPNWNSMRFDNPLFPNPKAMIDEVHANNAHIMISVWPSFGPATKLYKELDSINALITLSTWPTGIGVKPYDPFNPEAGKIYWKYLKYINDLGMDAWWLDGTEPDHFDRKEVDMENKMYYGSYRRMKNAYPIACNKTVYENLREVNNGKRVFLLTRSATFGQQRYASGVWSGDVYSRWDVFRNQIAAGQNFALSGMPYWNTDIGGFFAWEYGDNINNKEYQELYVRWNAFAAFNPVMRSHNSSPTKVEIYQFGERGYWAFDAIEKFINIRYHILPYTYSTAWQVTSNSGTFIRPLLMDFKDDAKAQNLANEYMYGKSFLVCAVTEPMYTQKVTLDKGGELKIVKDEPTAVTSEEEVIPIIEPEEDNGVEDFSKVKSYPVYLPKGTSWFDFFTNEKFEGGQTIERPTPIDELPVYVKGGSVVVYGPKVQYSTEKSWDTLSVVVYPGEDAVFTLYEDEFDNYNYEKGKYSTIDMSWNESEQTLTIEKRKGSYNGMLKSRVFMVKRADKSGEAIPIQYKGKAVSCSL